MILIAKNKLCFVDGTLPQPSKNDPLFHSQIRFDTMVFSWLLNSLTKEIAASVIFIESADNVRKEHCECFSHCNNIQIFQLRKAIFSLTQEQSSVNAYFTHLNAIWNEIHNYHPFSMCSCGAMKTVVDFHQQEYVLQYLMGINESFTNTRGTISSSESALSSSIPSF
ncbi:hypothetical protein I3843_03G136300 [Carya illinoinensis]|nr:hypothetical protein I3843_03G136300 [Carya illinoinensis]KAG7987478.1 hypothetical protein I3843_03G136300 [Carya illinoinensis]KAG7987479.1 hypothetical protein I3843_03G136300 [Carya illinoinensis]KAG7987480.1 hypothetical protein I3843_03G136300 [Carya illinoinensis]